VINKLLLLHLVGSSILLYLQCGVSECVIDESHRGGLDQIGLSRHDKEIVAHLVASQFHK